MEETTRFGLRPEFLAEIDLASPYSLTRTTASCAFSLSEVALEQLVPYVAMTSWGRCVAKTSLRLCPQNCTAPTSGFCSESLTEKFSF